MSVALPRSSTALGGWLGDPPGVPGDPAVILRGEHGIETLSRAGLADRIAAVAGLLAGERRLVHVHGTNAPPTLVGYLGAHAAGHAVLITPPGAPAASIAEAWDPDITIAVDGTVRVHREFAGRPLHPDLALLLSTSGSTGSPRLVRLSWENLRSNAEAIAEYLAVRPTDRAVTSLPLHYCYGLSVVHSHLLAGACVVLTDLSVADACFWDLARDTGTTTLAGVPHSFELLDRIGFAAMDLPDLRTVTQAGGRLDPDRVTALATSAGREDGTSSSVYGQTEATARMTYLPPDLAAEHPGTVGVPVPGGHVDLVDGEVVYSGPNVMLGYASEPGDLALGRRPTGCTRATSAGGPTPDCSRSPAAGPAWRRCSATGSTSSTSSAPCEPRAATCGASTAARASCCAPPVPRGRPGRTRGAPGRHPHAVRTGGGTAGPGPGRHPHLPTGKVDYATLGTLAASGVAAAPDVGGLTGSLRERYAVLLGPRRRGARGLVHVPGRRLAVLRGGFAARRGAARVPPLGWHLMTLAELESLERRSPEYPSARRGRVAWLRGRVPTRSVESSVVLRAVAIVLIVGTHAHVFTLQGTAHALLVLVGWNLARFRLSDVPRPERVRGLLTAVRRIAAPALVVIAGAHLLTGQYALSTLALVNWVFGEARLGPDWRFWFIESAVLVLVVVTAVVATPWGDRLERRHPFALPMALAGVGMLAWREVLFPPVPHMQGSALVVSWLFCLGWAAAKARGAAQRLVVTAVAIPTIGTFSGNPAATC